VASSRSTSSRVRSPIEIRWRRGGGLGGRKSSLMTWISPMGLLRDQDAVDFVHLDELDLDALVTGGGQVLADVVGPDRQLAVAAVGEHCELHPVGPAVGEERLDRGANRAAGVEDVVHEHAGHALEREVESG